MPTKKKNVLNLNDANIKYVAKTEEIIRRFSLMFGDLKISYFRAVSSEWVLLTKTISFNSFEKKRPQF